MRNKIWKLSGAAARTGVFIDNRIKVITGRIKGKVVTK